MAVAAPKTIVVVKDFFLKLYIPFVIRFDEILKVDVSVFNYLSNKKPINVEVKIISNSEDFEFVDANMGTCQFTAKDNMDHDTKSITVPHGNGEKTFFLIR